MPRKISIRLDQVSCEALLHDDAPTMSGLFWNALPLIGELRHVRWSGEAGYILADSLKHENPPNERRVSMYAPGQIVLRPEHAELAFGYGQGQARDSTSRGTEGCHIASVITNVDEFLQRVAETRRTGWAPIQITRAEGD
jgi:Protein of unknown function (DUF3830)